MISLASFLHRDELRELIARWLVNDFRPSDPDRIKELVNFNSLFVRRARQRVAEELFPGVFEHEAVPTPVWSKGQFRDLLVKASETHPCRDPHQVASRVARYASHRELFYCDMPFEGIVYRSRVHDTLMAVSRIKRVGRIAEKCNRRIVEAVFAMIEKEASVLIRGGAGWEAVGVPPTPSQLSDDDLRAAEERVLAEIARGRMGAVETPLVINDVLGFKLIGNQELITRFISWVDSRPDLELLEQQEHHGDYKAVNYVLRWQPPLEQMSSRSIDGEAEAILRSRGMDDDLQAKYVRFMLSGEGSIHLEVIVQSYEEALESEIGRSMHEERVIRQRQRREFQISVAHNIATLTRFLFYFALSRRTSLEGIPLKLWVRYMPESLEQMLYSLTDFPAGQLGLVP